jgi:hypothetical protein
MVWLQAPTLACKHDKSSGDGSGKYDPSKVVKPQDAGGQHSGGKDQGGKDQGGKDQGGKGSGSGGER